MQRICTFRVPAESVQETGLGGDHDRSPVQQTAHRALVRQTERFFPNLSPSSTISGYGIGPSSVSLRPCGADERIADLIFAHSHGAREKRHPKQASWCRRSEDATSRLERRRITAWNGGGTSPTLQRIPASRAAQLLLFDRRMGLPTWARSSICKAIKSEKVRSR
jgi:hypothetical protein